MSTIKTLLAVLIVALGATTAIAADAPKLESIFNGKDLTGWKVPGEPGKNVWFTVEAEVLRVRSGPKRQGQTLWTVKEYRDFVIEFDFKFGKGIVDSGIYVRNAKEQIQIGISGSLKRDMTASPYISGKGYPVEASGVKKLLKPSDWNTMRIKAKGKLYVVWLNGKKVMTYESESAIEKGRIGIQLHGSRDMAIDYRKLRATELK